MKPGNPPYLEYVRSSVEEKTKRLQHIISNRLKDEILLKGRPDLIYESQFIPGWEPSGVPVSSAANLMRLSKSNNNQDAIEITRCVGNRITRAKDQEFDFGLYPPDGCSSWPTP